MNENVNTQTPSVFAVCESTSLVEGEKTKRGSKVTSQSLRDSSP